MSDLGIWTLVFWLVGGMGVLSYSVARVATRTDALEKRLEDLESGEADE